MATFKQYTKKNGSTGWQVSAYLGIDPATNKQVNVKKKGFSTKKEAQLYLNRLIVEIEQNGFNKARSTKFEDVYLLWLETYKLTVKESSLVKMRERINKNFIPVFGHRKMDDITVHEVQRFANSLCDIMKNYREYMGTLSRIFEFAIKQGLAKKNPVKLITMPKRKTDISEKKVKYFTKEQLKVLLEDAKQNEPFKFYVFFYLLAHTGCRKGEILGLQWHGIDFDNQILTVKQTLARGENRRLYLEEPKTTGSNRVVPLDKQTIQLLRQWRKVQRSEMLQLGINTMSAEQLVFPDTDNGFIQLDRPNNWLQRICKRTGIPVLTCHALRHTFATILIGQGVNFKTVSELLGHTTVAMTLDTYTGVYQKDKEETIELLASVLK